MELELRLFAAVRDAVGRKTLRWTAREGDTVGDVLGAFQAEHPAVPDLLTDDGSLSPSISVLVNGRHVSHLDGVDTPLSDGDAVSVIPPVTGGGRLRPGRSA